MKRKEDETRCIILGQDDQVLLKYLNHGSSDKKIIVECEDLRWMVIATPHAN